MGAVFKSRASIGEEWHECERERPVISLVASPGLFVSSTVAEGKEHVPPCDPAKGEGEFDEFPESWLEVPLEDHRMEATCGRFSAPRGEDWGNGITILIANFHRNLDVAVCAADSATSKVCYTPTRLAVP